LTRSTARRLEQKKTNVGARHGRRAREEPAAGLPNFLARFGTDAQCRAHLLEASWPDGFCCGRCGHDRAWSHHRRLIDECRARGKQHSILKGTLFEQTKSGLARWFLAIYPVISGKGGISALELQRQMGFRSYGTAPPRACCDQLLHGVGSIVS